MSQAKPANTAKTYMVIGGDIGKPINDITKATLVKYGIAANDYQLVMSAYPGNRQIVLKKELIKLTKRRNRAKVLQLFRLAVETVEAGMQPVLSDSQEIDPRMFFPALPEGFCQFCTMKDIVERTDRLRMVNAKAAELMAAQVSDNEIRQAIDHIWAVGEELPVQETEKLVEIMPDDSKSQIKHEVKFCGERIWPNEYLKDVTYADMNTGWHVVHHWVSSLEHATPQKPKEVAVQIRALIHDIQEASSLQGLIDVMIMCITAYSKRNDTESTADLSGCVPPGLAR